MAMCNKRFIHSSSISLQRFASLHYLPLHYTSIHFTIYFAPHSKSIPSFHIAKPTAYAMAASFAAVCAIAGGLLIFNLQQPTASIARAQMPIQVAIPQLVASEVTADPHQTAALMAQIEQMRHGNCQLIEAIQLPDSQKGIYLNMVVNGQVSTDPKEQAIAFELLRRTRCNYTPMLMANSTG